MALFRGIQEYIALDANNITLIFDSGNIVNISGNIFLYPPQGHPILYKCSTHDPTLYTVGLHCQLLPECLRAKQVGGLYHFYGLWYDLARAKSTTYRM